MKLSHSHNCSRARINHPVYDSFGHNAGSLGISGKIGIQRFDVQAKNPMSCWHLVETQAQALCRCPDSFARRDSVSHTTTLPDVLQRDPAVSQADASQACFDDLSRV